MNMADRIQALRKAKGISQEELADKLGISRQAVSKWESEQSIPELDKIIAISELFGVTTDYILKGIEPIADKEEKSSDLTGKILYIASVAFVAIGLFCAFGGWYEKQTMESVWGSMIIQAVGIAGYFIAKLISAEKPPFAVTWLNIMGILFMPLSMITGIISVFVFKQGWAAPYPMQLSHVVLFAAVYAFACGLSYIILRKKSRL